jgi:hypothetical protein
MPERKVNWKCLVALLAAPLAFGCSDGDKKSQVDAALPGVDAPAAADAARDVVIAKDTPVAVDVAINLDTVVGDVAIKPDTPAVDATAVDAPLGTPDASGDATPDGLGEEAGLACAIVPAFKGGILKTDLTLTRACSPYTISEQIRVEGNATLTIEPGVTMMFKKDVELTIAYSGPGRVVAVGTAALPIVMTSAATIPSAGDWAGIRFYGETATGNQLSYVTLDYCGRNKSACIVGLTGVESGAVTIDHVTIDHVGAGGNGINEDGTDLAFKITNTTFKTGAIPAGNFAIALDAGSFAGIGAGNVFNGATINLDGGTVKSTSTWINPGTPIVVTSTFRVEGTASPILTLSAGTTMQFDADVALWVGYTGAGQLVAVGTAAAPIVMTSKAVTPGPGDWNGISLWDGTANGTKLAYLKLDYCGAPNSACIDATSGVKSDRVTIDHVTFDHVGPKANGIDENGTDSRFKISNCTFVAGAIPAGQYAIFVQAPSFATIDTTNEFGGALIGLDGGDIVATTSWSNPGTPIAVTRDIRVQDVTTPVLTIAAGSVFKFGADKAIWVGYGDPGKLVISGTAAAHVTLTSLASSPAKGDWNGIIVWNTSQATLAYTDILYAGGYSSAAGGVAANSDKAVVSLTNSTVSNSAGYGVYVACDNVSVTTTSCTYSNNNNEGMGPGPTCP